MINYLVQTTLCWSCFYGLYYLFLSKETFFSINRWYLLLSVSLGAIFPLLDWSTLWTVSESQISGTVQPIVIGIEQMEAIVVRSTQASNWTWKFFLQIVYGVGMLWMSIQLVRGLWKIMEIIRKGSKLHEESFTWIFHGQIRNPFSFFRYLFTSDHVQFDEEEREKIKTHELAHIREGHSVDVLLMEILTIVFWFHPLIYLYKRSLRLAHEYIADQAVLKNTNKKQYGHLLLRQAQSGPAVPLANNFNYSQLKKRFIMMKKSKSKPQATVKYLLAMPLLLSIAFLFASAAQYKNFIKEEASNVIKADSIPMFSKQAPIAQVDQMPVFPGCSGQELSCADKQLLMFIYKDIRYPVEARNLGIEGKVVAKFTVDESGRVQNPQVINSVTQVLDAEVLRIIQEMPQWTPAMKAGKPTSIDIQLPIVFKLEDENGNQNAPSLERKTGLESLATIPTVVVTGYGVLNNKVHIQDVDQMPLFQGDCEAETDKELELCAQKHLFQFIYKNIKCPKAARDAGVEGTAIVSFVVDKNGLILDPKIKRSLGFGIDEEVLRIVDEMPEWVPALKDKEAVNFRLNLPIKFKLGNESAEKTPHDPSAILKDVRKTVEEMPRFPAKGCDESALTTCSNQQLMEFVGNHIAYPKAAKAAGTEGVVVVGFVVRKDGSITNIELKRNIGAGCGKAAMHAVNMLPPFIPGQENGEPVAVQMYLPFHFVLPKNNAAAGIPEQLALTDYQLSPNPTSGLFQLQFKGEAEPLQIQITNLNGQTVQSIDRGSFDGYFNETIDLSSYPDGIYFLRIQQEGKVTTKKLVLSQ